MRLIVHTSSLAAGAMLDGLTEEQVEDVLGAWTTGKIVGVPADWGVMYFHPQHVVRLDVIGDSP